MIYTLTDWPLGARSLPVSLKESGKSRADLWAFAGSVGLERAIDWSNFNCQSSDPYFNTEYMVHDMKLLSNLFVYLILHMILLDEGNDRTM